MWTRPPTGLQVTRLFPLGPTMAQSPDRSPPPTVAAAASRGPVPAPSPRLCAWLGALSSGFAEVGLLELTRLPSLQTTGWVENAALISPGTNTASGPTLDRRCGYFSSSAPRRELLPGCDSRLSAMKSLGPGPALWAVGRSQPHGHAPPPPLLRAPLAGLPDPWTSPDIILVPRVLQVCS